MRLASQVPFSKSAAFYDAVYSWKKYGEETATLRSLIKEHKRSAGTTLLDVACGTGMHLALLRAHYAAEGLDLDPQLLAAAADRCPGITLHHGDMEEFDLGRTLDVVTCLFSSIAYMETAARMKSAVAAMARHLTPGGLLLVEPFFFPDQFANGHVASTFVEQPELRIARMSVSEVHDSVAHLNFHYLIAQPSGVTHLTEDHRLGLFERSQYEAAFREAGLEVTYESRDPFRNGLFVGVKAGRAVSWPLAPRAVLEPNALLLEAEHPSRRLALPGSANGPFRRRSAAYVGT